jgi:hypothetical protein
MVGTLALTPALSPGERVNRSPVLWDVGRWSWRRTGTFPVRGMNVRGNDSSGERFATIPLTIIPLTELAGDAKGFIRSNRSDAAGCS